MSTDRDLIKEKFQNGDKPNAADFARIIDSTINFTDDNVSVVGGKVGIKTTDPKATLHVYDDNPDGVTPGIGGAALMIGNQAGKNISIDANEITAKNVAAPSILHLNPDGGHVTIHSNPISDSTIIFNDTGKVGIGTLSPQGPFHVNTANNPVIVDDSGNLGIGTTTPSDSLHIKETDPILKIERRNGSGVNARMTISANTINSDQFPDSWGLVLQENEDPLFVFGDLFYSKSFSAISDKKMKKNITKLKLGLADILKLNPVTFNWKKDDAGTEKTIGLIAQEVNEIIPQAINQGTSEGAPMGISYNELTPVLVKAVQEQQSHIEKLEARLAKLEKMMQKK
ncbi:MAG: hypothetical protein GQ574_09455 [Crocinitomix sp.]|nr:hypothetical protein [Crocinitomix sp.]